MTDFFGIRKEDDGWRCFSDNGDYPGIFEQEAARWGTWAEPDDIQRINGDENRLITMEDIRAIIRRRSPEPARL